MWTAKATIPPIKTRLAAQVAKLGAHEIECRSMDACCSVGNGDALKLALRDIQLLLGCVDDFQKQHGTALELLRDNPSTENSRRTGRTTRLLLRAMIALSAGKDVAVIGINAQQAMAMKVDIERHARGWHIPYDGGPWAERGEPGDRLPMVRAFTPDGEMTGFRGVTLVDHAVIERM